MASLESRSQRAVVEILEFPTDRNAMGEARDPDAARSQPIHDVVRRRLAIDRHIGRKDYFIHMTRIYAINQGTDVEIFRSHAVECRQYSTQYVIASLEGAGPLECP